MASTEVSATRLYLGNLPKGATKQDVEAHFATHGTGEITEIKLMNGFGFIEYKDAMDARDVVPDGSDFMGERLTVQFARGSRQREGFGAHERSAPRPRRTIYRMQITGLPNDTSWQDLKDFARQSSLDVVYSETGRDGNGRGFVEFETAADLKTAVEKLDNREFKGQRVNCVADETAVLVRPRADGPTECLQMATTADLLRVAIVLGATATIIAIEALAVITMKTAAIGHLRVAVQLMNTAHPVDVTMTPTDESIRRPIRMSTVVPMTVPHGTSPHEKVATGHVKVVRILVRTIGEEVTASPQTKEDMSEPTGLIAKSGIELLTFGTPNGYKISILLEELKEAYGKEYTWQSVNILKNTQKEPWFVAAGANGRIPAIVDHDRDGFAVFEGLAILGYLTRRYDPEHKFSFPVDSNEYDEAETWMAWQHGGLGPMQGQANHFFRFTKEKIPYGIQRYVGETERLYGVLNARLADREYVVGGKFSIADINLLGWVNAASLAGIDLEGQFPHVQSWLERCLARPAVQKGFAVPNESSFTNAAVKKAIETDPEIKKQTEELAKLLKDAKEKYGYKYASP
ncbi:hypothetical protein GQX73_g2621 [Xylaria multiplex]|uniref:RRM domain-containing protein n=1 Tax=Xylaria multiplex TaxID=323545 RepID=A0A7C8J586_9PEZI|nr:hypothetical protein GQX73_g2621 [Xylaria multiplex]